MTTNDNILCSALRSFSNTIPTMKGISTSTRNIPITPNNIAKVEPETNSDDKSLDGTYPDGSSITTDDSNTSDKINLFNGILSVDVGTTLDLP